MPHFISNELKAADAANRGGYTTAGGTMLYPIDTKNPADISELVAQGLLGYTPTGLSEAQEKYYAEQLSVRFYESQRRILLANLAQAVADKNPEERAAAYQEIRKFNASAPKGVYIIGESIIKSVHEKAASDAAKAKNQRKGQEAAMAKAADEAFTPPSP
jgi:hypothetical protein